MIYLFISLALLVGLFWLKNRFESEVLSLFQSLLVFKKLSYFCFAVLYLPTTLMHESSHYLAALILRVPLSSVNVLPQVKNDQLILGSVTHQKTTQFRQIIISIAPVFLGMIAIYLTMSPPEFLQYIKPSYLPFIFYFYLIMASFPSRGDIQNISTSLIFLTLIFTTIFWFGLQYLSADYQTTIIHFLQVANNILLLFGIIILFLIFIIKIFATCLQYLLKNF